MFMTKPETKLRDSKIFPMRIQPLLCRGEILSLGFYDLDTLSLRKKITVTKIGGQDEGFGFSPDGRFFYNIESPTCFVRTQLSVYETREFSKVCTLFSENKRMMLEHLEFDDNTCYLLGYMRDDADMFDYGFIAVFDAESKAVKTFVPLTENNMTIYRITNTGS